MEKEKSSSELPQWAKIQKKTFKNWVNVHLADRNLKIADLQSDLSDGIMLINLLEIISAKKLGRYNKTCKFQSQKLENVQTGLKFLKDEGIKLVAIGPEDVVEKRIKLILGLVWTIILRWQIQKINNGDVDKNSDAKAELIAWVNSVIPHNPVKNLKKDWQDGKALAALTNYLVPESVETTPDDDALSLTTKAVNAAEKEAQVAQVISPEDIVSEDLDDLSMMTYVAMFRDRANQMRSADPTKFEAYGQGLKHPVVGKRNQFIVEARNSNGERVRVGGHPVNSHFVPENSLDTAPAKVRDAKDGTYTVSYIPRAAGTFLVHVAVDKTPIKNSPFTVNVTNPTPYDVALSSVDPNIYEKEGSHPRVYYTTAITRNSDGEQLKVGGALIVANVLPMNGRDEFDSIVEDNEDGTYEILFKQPPAGQYKVQVGLPDSGGEKVSQHVKNSPFTFSINADGEIESNVPVPSPDHTVVKGDGVEKGKTDKPAEFTIHAKDSTGKAIPALDIHFVASVTDPNGKKSPITLTPTGNDLAGEYTPTTPGEYTVQVNVAAIRKSPETPVKDSPFTVPVISSADASRSELTGPGITENDLPVTTGPSNFVIKSFDKEGHPLKEGGEEFKASVDGPAGNVALDVHDNGDGTYGFEYSPKEAGKHVISVKVDGTDVSNSPATIDIVAAPSGQHTTVEGDGVEKGKTDKPSTFKIHAKDASGKSIPAPAALFSATITDPAGNKESVSLKPDGNALTGEYTPTTPGEYTVEVDVNEKGTNTPVKDSPFTVPVRASADASRTELSGPGITEKDAPVTTGPSQYVIKSFDKNGNPLTEGGEDVEVSAKGPDGKTIKLEPQDNGDGTYTVEYTPEEAGDHTLTAKVDGVEVSNSPAVISIVAEPSGEHTTVEGDGVKKGNTDKPSKFKIHSKNAKGASIPALADLHKATLTDPEGNKTTIELIPDGNTLVGEYTPTTPGEYTVEINVDNKKGTESPVKDSPFTVPVRASADASNTELTGPGITDKDAFVTTEPTPFVIKSSDKNGKPLTDGGEEIVATATGPDGKEVPLEVKDNGDGTYGFEYTPEEAGKHTLSVKVDGQDVNNSPATLDVKGISAEHTKVDGDGVKKGKTDKPSKFKIHPRDANNKPVEAPAEQFTVSLTDPEGNKSTIALTPEGDGLVGEYTPTLAGEYVVDVNVGNDAVKDSPFTVPVKTSAVATNSELSGPSITDKDSFVNTTEPSYFEIKSFDKEGNPISEGGEEYAVTIKGPEGDVPHEVKDNGDGTYRVEYAPTDAGKHKISVKLDGEDIKNSPATVEVEEGPDEENTFAVDYMFTIEAKTKSGATRVRGGDKFEVVIADKEGVEVEGVRIEDLAAEGSPGKYRVWYTLPGPGKYKVTATLNGKNIKGSPWKQSL